MKKLKNLSKLFICCFLFASIISCDNSDDEILIKEEGVSLETEALESKLINYRELENFTDIKNKFDVINENPEQYLKGLTINLQFEMTYLETTSGLRLIQIPLLKKDNTVSEFILNFKIDNESSIVYTTNNNNELSETKFISLPQLKGGPTKPCVPHFYTVTVCESNWVRADGSGRPCRGYDPNGNWEGAAGIDTCEYVTSCRTYTDVACGAL
ncbi:hypothetical protein [Nonlabens sp. Asnod3-A02]|uniref:hypothetical protein n=1 Tax=Nonlabens sp. Asnod3-A02 TaxID=3160579 RepID=UPI003866CAAD